MIIERKCLIAGHSKWAQIKHKKASTDKKRSNLFGKLANTITVAARSGTDPSMNPSLQMAIDRAKSENMPKDNIERAITRGGGSASGIQVEEMTYEIYGPSGIAILAMALTDNKNRTTAEVKAVINKFGGKIAGSGAVNFLFDQKGLMRVSIDGRGSENIELVIIDSGAEDYQKVGDEYLIYTKPKEVKETADRITGQDLKIISSELVMDPKETVSLPEEEAGKVIKLLEALDELDDVVGVNSNLG